MLKRQTQRGFDTSEDIAAALELLKIASSVEKLQKPRNQHNTETVLLLYRENKLGYTDGNAACHGCLPYSFCSEISPTLQARCAKLSKPQNDQKTLIENGASQDRSTELNWSHYCHRKQDVKGR